MITYFKSALSEVWQDKRTLWSRLYMPLLLFSGLLFIISILLNDMGGGNSDSGDENGQSSESPKSTVGIITNNNGANLVSQLKGIKTVDYQMVDNMDTVQTMMDNGDLDLAVVIDEFFDDAIKTGNSGEVLIFHNGYDDALKEGIKNNIDGYERQVLNQRLAASGFDASYTDPVNVSEVNAPDFTNTNTDNTETHSNDNAAGFNEVGGIFMLLLFYFAFLGGIYPALSLFTSDRLLSIITDEPQKVLLGRTLAVAFFGLLHSLLFLGIVFLIFRPYQSSSNLYTAMLKTSLQTDMLPVIILSLVPLVTLFATFNSWSVTKRGTFKEAQNRLQPLKVSIGLFLLFGITAGLGTSFGIFAIPVLNVGTLSRLLLQNNLNWLYLIITFVSLFGFAYLCYQQALKEFLKRVQQPAIFEDISDIIEIGNTPDVVDLDNHENLDK